MPSSAERLEALEEELANLREELAGMQAHWQSEKEAIGQIRTLKEEHDALSTALDREADLERAAEIRFGKLPELGAPDRRRRTSNWPSSKPTGKC